MPQQKDYYQILGVDRNASAEDIRKAYRALARKLHPDVNRAADAAERFAEVQEAYDVLSDEEKRQAYNQFGHAGVGRAAAGAGREGAYTYTWQGGDDFGGFGAEDFESIFDQFMAGSRGFGRTRTARQRERAAPPGVDIRHTIEVPFMTAVTGGTQEIRITQPDGSSETIEVKIPAGIDSGARLRVRGKGQSRRPAGAPGDLILTITVSPHPYFRRRGLDVLLDVPVTIAEAALGAKVTVPLLKGTVELRIPPGTSSGQKLRVRGRGVRDARGRTGDFHAVIQIVAPRKLTDEDRHCLEATAERLENPREKLPWADRGPYSH